MTKKHFTTKPKSLWWRALGARLQTWFSADAHFLGRANQVPNDNTLARCDGLLHPPKRWSMLVVGAVVGLAGCLTPCERDMDLGKLFADGTLLLDVRTTSEFGGERLEGAVNMPIKQLPQDYVRLAYG